VTYPPTSSSSSSFSSRPPKRGGIPLLVKILGGLVLLVIVALVALGFAAESIVNKQKDKALADLSAQLGRPVTAGKIAFSLLRGRFELSDVAIGRDPGLPEEPDPAFALGHAQVDVKLWPLIRSLGKDAAVQAIAVERLTVAVVRLPDGELNWQKVAAKLGPSEPEEAPKPLDPEVQTKIRAALIEQIRIDDVALQFIDLENKGAKVAINDLDIALDNVSLHAPFALKITAAILAQAKNFDLDARFATAPDVAGAIAPPPLEHATIKLAPTALAPLAPFLAALAQPPATTKTQARKAKAAPEVGIRQLTEGNLAMDLDLGAGSAVPGGSGPTDFRGFVELAGLKFAGGEKFDARLDSDITAQVPGGAPDTVDIKKFSARFGDMGIDAKGKLSDLSGTPQVDGFTVDSHALDFTRLHTFYPPLDKTAGAQLRGPFALHARGSASEGKQKLVANLDLTAASIDVPGQFRKPAGTALVIDIAAAARPNLIEMEKAALTLAALTIKASATVRTAGTGPKARRSFDANVDVPPVAVRDLVAIFAPKQLADVPAVRFGATVQAKGSVGDDESIDVKVPQFSLTGGKSDLQGSLAVANLKAPKLNVDARSKYLDVDDFLPASAKSTAPKPAGDAAKSKAKDAPPEPLPPQVQAMDGVIKLAVDRGRASDIDFQKLKTDLAVKNGRLTARTLEVDTFNGHFSGAGTELPLADPKAGFHAKGEVSNLDISAVLGRFAAERNFMSGRLFSKIDLSGTGTLPEQLKASLEGKLSGRVENAELKTAGLLSPIVDTLEKATGVPLLSKYVAGAKARVAKLNDRHLDKLGGILHFANGAMELVKPMEANTPSGPLSLTGKVTLGGDADMNAQLAMSPAIANMIAGGKARFDGPIPIALRIDGPVTSPRFRPADPAALIKVFATALAKGEGGRMVTEKVQQVMANPQVQKAKLEAEQAQARANAEAQRAQQEAAQKAEQVRQEADRRAQAAKDEAARKAKEAAGKGLRGILGR
jgi:hypothetical protein